MLRAKFLLPFFCILLSCTSDRKSNKYSSWDHYGGSSEMIRYSSLTQIDTTNVANLKVLWQYESGQADSANASQIQCNPIIVDGILYGVNPGMALFAIDAASGKQIWTFNANTHTDVDGLRYVFHILINSRGLAYWTDGKNDKRIFFTAGSMTYALDALTGRIIPSFGTNGYIDLHKDLDQEDTDDLMVVSTSPGIVYKDLLIMGTRVHEDLPSAPGHIRAYNVRTGKRQWIFHTIPHPGEYGFETWQDSLSYKKIGGANVWSGFSLDQNKGIVYCGTGSAAFDFYGGNRKGSNLFANCVLALDATSGKRIWHQQLMHHDVWDKDIPTPPALITINKGGTKIEAVAQPTKNGYVYIFDRVTGRPIYDIKEIEVDTHSELVNEKLWPTQPIPSAPAPFARQTISIDDINPYVSAKEKESLKKELASYRYGSPYLAPGHHKSIVYPGYDGGAEWGGPAYDPETGILYLNSNEMAWIMEMVVSKTPPQKTPQTYLEAGKGLYAVHCSSCHGQDRKGLGNSPNIATIQTRYNKEQLLHLINHGRRMMPSFKRLGTEEKEAIVSFILDLKEDQKKILQPQKSKYDLAKLMPYRLNGYKKFLTKDGYPAIKPPWGNLTAIDLNTATQLWQVPFGEYPELKAKGIPTTGTENYGGPVVTAGGVLFIGATKDGYFRAFNKKTGKILWQYKLPAPAFATPAVYQINGKQVVVVACGGGKLGSPVSDKYIAFSL